MSDVQLQIEQCPACGEFLTRGRKNKRFHNNACRARWFRMIRDVKEHATVCQRYIADMQQIISMGGEVAPVGEALLEIAMTLQDVVHHAPVGFSVGVEKYHV